MRAVIQRVNKCHVEINGDVYSKIQEGLLVLLGIKEDDNSQDIVYLIDKILHLRIFEDENGKMNKSCLELKKQIMLVSQFTLYGDCKKGRRPSFIQAAKPKDAEVIYNKFISELSARDVYLQTGVFGAEMKVNLENDGPVTILLDSEKQF